MEIAVIGLKLCKTCQVPKPTTEFYRNDTAKDGFRSTCKPCYCAQSREYRKGKPPRKRSNSIFCDPTMMAINRYNYIKRRYEKQKQWALKRLGGKCIDCGLEGPMECLDFDHIDPAQKVDNVGRLLRATGDLKKLAAEVDKCQILCANCHRIKSKKNGHTGPKRKWLPKDYDREPSS